MHPPSTKIYTLSLHDALPILNTEYWILAAMLKPWQKDADFLADVAETRGDTQHLDRKSTRLNSSHANISYAVFCLKKKIKTPTQCGSRQEKREIADGARCRNC